MVDFEVDKMNINDNSEEYKSYPDPNQNNKI